MRYLTIFLLWVAALTSACQPITPPSMSITLADLKTDKLTPKQALAKTIAINNSQDKSQTKIELIVEPKKTPSISDSQDVTPTETKLAVGDIPKSNDAHTISKSPESVVPQIVLIAPKAFNPKDIIGFTIPVLIRDLGHATIIRQEGPAEVWQYHFKNCIIDFFFYSIHEPAPKLTAKNWDIRSTIIGKNFDRADCLDEIKMHHQDVLAN